MYKKGDHIRLKNGTELESGEIIENWAGTVEEVYTQEKTCLIMLDSETIRSLDDSYLESCIEEGADPFEYVFEFNDLELSTRRDTDEELMKELDKLAVRMIELEGGELDMDEAQKEEWIEGFLQSPDYEELTEYQKENSSFIISTFMDFLYNYEYVHPKDWKSTNVKEVCLHVVPRKITSELELFENYGEVVQRFLRFLGSKSYISNALELEETVEQIKDNISKEANNPANWGMAKTMMMGGQDSGIDFSNEEDLQNYVLRINEKIQRENSQISNAKSTRFDKIGRNERITVKYKNGKVIEKIKFKKVEHDLKEGKCELIE